MKTALSFEIFPPKKEADLLDLPVLLQALQAQKPAFVSVTCGAGGSNGALGLTATIAERLIREYNTPAVAHLTCVGATHQTVQAALAELRERGVDNVLALRGDLPDGTPPSGDYLYAKDLITALRQAGGFRVGAACYPEGHITCPDAQTDLKHMLAKQEAGADYFISQICFDNDIFFRFLDRARAAGITAPIHLGIMPIFRREQLLRMILMCGATLPSALIKLLARHENSPADLRAAGIEFCVAQLEALVSHGVDGVHVYMMNKPDVAAVCTKAFERHAANPS